MWGLDCLVRIYLRSTLRREPSEEEIGDVLNDKNKRKTISNKVTERQIIDAFGRGDEVGVRHLSHARCNDIRLKVLGVYCMKCIGYDVTWQQFLVDHYPGWVAEYRTKRASIVAKRGAEQQARKNRVRAIKKSRQDRATSNRQQLAREAGLIGDLSDLSAISESENEILFSAAQEAVEVVDAQQEDTPADESVPLYVTKQRVKESAESLVLRNIAKGTRSRPRGTRFEPIVVD